MALFAGTQIAADGNRYPIGDIPDFTPEELSAAAGRMVRVFGIPDDSKVIRWVDGQPTWGEEPVPYALTVALLGDSITENNGGGPDLQVNPIAGLSSYNNSGYWTWASIGLNHRMQLAYNFGVSGYTTSDVLSTALPSLLALDPRPTFAIICAGINDVIEGVPTMTIEANLDEITTTLLEAGITPVLCTLLPVTNAILSSTAMRSSRLAVNEWIRSRRYLSPVLVCDWAPAYADPVTGEALAAYCSDGLHPSMAGAQEIGKHLAQLLAPLAPIALPTGLESEADAANYLQHGFFSGSGGTVDTGITGTLAASWGANWSFSTAGTAACSKVTRTDGIQGSWQQVAISAAGGDAFQLYQEVQSGLPSAGTDLVGEIEFQLDDDVSDVDQFYLRLAAFNSDYSEKLYEVDDNYPFDTNTSLVASPFSGTLRTPVLTVPEGTANLDYVIRITGTGTFRFGRARLVRV